MEYQRDYFVDEQNTSILSICGANDVRTTALILAKSDYYRLVRLPLRYWIGRLLIEAEIRGLDIVRSDNLDPDGSDEDHIIYWRQKMLSPNIRNDIFGHKVKLLYKSFKNNNLRRYGEIEVFPRELEHFLLTDDWD